MNTFKISNEKAKKQQMKKMTHNEAEKKRIRAINMIVDDIREILDVHYCFSCFTV